jgi:hypothetical protein
VNIFKLTHYHFYRRRVVAAVTTRTTANRKHADSARYRFEGGCGASQSSRRADTGLIRVARRSGMKHDAITRATMKPAILSSVGGALA